MSENINTLRELIDGGTSSTLGKIKKAVSELNDSIEETNEIIQNLGKNSDDTANTILTNIASLSTTYQGWMMAMNTLQSAAAVESGKYTSALLTQTAASAAATASMQRLSTAMKAVPILAIASAAISLGQTLAEYIEIGQGTCEVNEKLAETTKEANEQLAQEHDEFAKSVAEAKANAEDARIEIYNLQQLWNEGIRGDTWNKEVEDAIEKCPELEGAVEKINGQWQLQQDKIDGVIQKIEEAAIAEAYKNRLVAVEEEKLEYQETNEPRIKQAKEERAALMNDKHNRYLQLKAQGFDDNSETMLAEMQYYNDKIAEKDAEIQTYGDTIANFDRTKDYYLQGQGEFALEQAQAAQAEEQANFDHKYLDQLETSIGGVIEEYQARAIPLMDAQQRLQEGVSTEELANLVNSLRASGMEIDQQDASSQERLLEVVNQAVAQMMQEMTADSAEKGAALLAVIDTAIQERKNQLNNTQDVEQQGQIQGEIDSLQAQRAEVQSTIEGMSQVFSTNGALQTTAVNNLANVIKNYSPTVEVDIVAKVSGIGQETAGAQTKAHALGTSFYPGGVTTINEQGDEMVELPTGSRIYPARESRRMYQRMNQGNYNINISDIVIREEADIDRIVTQIVNKLERARRNFA